MTFTSLITNLFPAEAVSAHCDGPCGVYDPASARIAAEAVVSMTKKIAALEGQTDLNSLNNMSRYIAIKEEQAHIAKTEVLVVKGIHKLAHPFDRIAELLSVLLEALRPHVVLLQRFVNRFRRHHPTVQREEHARRKYRIQKRGRRRSK